MDPRLKRLKNREVPKKETGKETMHLEEREKEREKEIIKRWKYTMRNIL